MKILIVDDSQLTRSRISKLLSKYPNVETNFATDGLNAIEYIENQVFDCIFMDVLMPNMNGFETLQELKRRGNTTPVIIMTADIQQSTTKRCKELGAFAIYGKPVNETKIEDIFQRLAQI